MTDNELVDLCMTCGLVLTCDYFKPGVDVDNALKSLRKSMSANLLLPANFHWANGTFSISAMILFALSRADRNSSWRISCSYPRIIIKEIFYDGDFLDYGLMTTSLESAYDHIS